MGDDPSTFLSGKFVAKKILSAEDYVKLHDANHDGFLSVDDCPFQAKSAEAKLWIKNVLDPYVRNSITDEMREIYGDKVKGAYLGNPIVPGEPGSYEQPQADMDYWIDKVRLTEDVDFFTARNIVQKILDSKQSTGV
jgi:hypothetical protein